MSINEKLSSLDINIPEVPKSLGSYIPCRRAGDLLYISGQLPKINNEMIQGKLGKDLSIEEGQNACKIAFINVLAIIKSELGDLNNVDFFVRLVGYINSSDGFTEQAKVMNGASDFAFEIFGENGRHARLALGVNELPLNAACEIEAIVKIK